MSEQIYYSPGTNGFYNKRINNNIPSDIIPVDDAHYKHLILEQSLGKKIKFEDGRLVAESPPSQEEVLERMWRDSELSRADTELNKVQDSDRKATGTVSEWRTYRKALRDWPESINFPSKDKRPKAPDRS